MNKATIEGYENMDVFISNSFLSVQEGILRPNRFIVGIRVPESIKSWVDKDLEDLTNTSKILGFNVQGVQCPNIGFDMGVLNTNNQYLNYYKERNDQDLTISFLEDANLSIRRLFNSWMRAGFDARTKQRRYASEVWAPEILVCPVLSDGKTSNIAEVFFRCMPFDIIDMNFDMATENTFQKTDVKFKYSNHDCIDTKTFNGQYEQG